MVSVLSNHSSRLAASGRQNQRRLRRYRREMFYHFPKKLYGQRWQIETTFSMLKQLAGSAIQSRRRYAINRKIVLRVMTINLMLVLHLIT